MFHFVTREYFRDLSESDSDSDDDFAERPQRGEFVAGGIYSPAANSLNMVAQEINQHVALAAGIKRVDSMSAKDVPAAIKK